MRTIVDLARQQVDILDRISKSQKVSRAELIRRAISEYLKKTFSPADDQVFGLWKGRNVDAMSYQRKLRDEWGK